MLLKNTSKRMGNPSMTLTKWLIVFLRGIEPSKDITPIRPLSKSSNRQVWKNILWFVTVVRPGSTLERYRQWAQFQNHKRSPKYHVPLTFFDEMKNLHQEYNRTSTSYSNLSHAMIMNSYFGQGKVYTAMTIIASVAVRLTAKVIATIGEIINGEHTNSFQSKTTPILI